MSKLKNVAALGYYGFRNLGDEAVLAGIRQALREKIGDCDFHVLSNNPEETVRLHPGVHTIDRWKWREVAAGLRQTDLFIFGGGSLLQDATSVRSVLWYTLMVLLARRRAKKVLWWGQGIGPLKSPASQKMVRRIANQADALTVRDAASEQLLRSIGVRKAAEVVADPAFALKPTMSESPGHVQPCIFAPRLWKDDTLGEIIRANPGFWKDFEAKTKAPTLILPMHLPGDAEYARHLAPERSVSVADWNAEGRSVVEIMGQVAGAGAMVAMRLHALIFAARCGVPFVALSYDPKVNALTSAAGQEDILVSVESITQEILLSAIDRMVQSAATRRSHLRDFAAEQAMLATRPAEIASDLLH